MALWGFHISWPLVRAMQALYHAESVEEAELSLMPETADEEALRQLTERSQAATLILKVT